MKEILSAIFFLFLASLNSLSFCQETSITGFKGSPDNKNILKFVSNNTRIFDQETKQMVQLQEEKKGLLAIEADEDCIITIFFIDDRQEELNLKAGTSTKISLEARQYIIVVASIDGRYSYDTRVEVEDNLQTLVKTELAKAKQTKLKEQAKELEEKKRKFEEQKKRIAKTTRKKTQEESKPIEESTQKKAIQEEYIKIPAGSFLMGKYSYQIVRGDADVYRDEDPGHKVIISRDFEIGKYEVMQKQWVAVMGSNPSNNQGDNLPVEQVSWEDIQEFIWKLNKMSDKYVYRLPTEAEWEYAARAGRTEEYAPQDLINMAWVNDNSCGLTHEVGSKQPNAWGLYDMQGNVAEWCNDWYDSDYYKYSSITDPQGPSVGKYRVIRGGSWDSKIKDNIVIARFFVFLQKYDCKSTDRSYGRPSYRYEYVGFRLVRQSK